tara:strand:- start:2943 stop:3236 length:294 start_codon:yes stop_codon:yes gene_type:complete
MPYHIKKYKGGSNPKSLLQLSLENVEKQINDVERISKPSDAPKKLGISAGKFTKMRLNLPYLKQGVTVARTGMLGKGKRITYVTTGTLNLPINYSKY